MPSLSSITVPYELARNPAPTIDGGPDGRSARMTFLIGLNDLGAFIAAIAGASETFDVPGGGGSVTRVIPLSHPDDPTLFVVAFGAEAFGTPGGTGASVYTPMFSHHRVAVDFATLPFGVAGDAAFYSLTTDHGVSMETLPGSVLTFPSGGKTTGEFALRVGTVAYTLTTYQSPDPVSVTVSNLVGKINSAAIWGFPAGTLRLNGVRSEYAKGMYSQTMVKSYSLQYREKPWNQVMNAVGVWETPTLGATGLTKYESGSFAALAYS